MATLRNKRKLAAVTREIQEENPGNGQSRNTSVPRINEEYITQLSEEIEGRVSKKLSQEFSRLESRILAALSKLDEFLLNQQITTHSETVPGTFGNTNVENQGTNEDDSQSDPHPEAGIFRGQTTQNFGPKDCRDRCHSHYMHLALDVHNKFNENVWVNSSFRIGWFHKCLLHMKKTLILYIKFLIGSNSLKFQFILPYFFRLSNTEVLTVNQNFDFRSHKEFRKNIA